jgi:hypothetical protein
VSRFVPSFTWHQLAGQLRRRHRSAANALRQAPRGRRRAQACAPAETRYRVAPGGNSGNRSIVFGMGNDLVGSIQFIQAKKNDKTDHGLPAPLRPLNPAAFRRPCPVVCGKSRVDCNLPPKPAAKIPKSARVLGAEHNFVLRLECNDEILAIAPHRHLSPVFHATLRCCTPPVYSPLSGGQGRLPMSSTILCRYTRAASIPF